jgi:hypothetical protein
MRRYVLIFLLIIGVVALVVFLVNSLPRISFLLVPSEIRQAVVDSLDCGDGTCTAINIRAKQTPVDAADQRNGIDTRWCVSYLRIEENTGSYTRNYLPWAYQTAKSYRFTLEKTHGSYEPLSYGRSSDGDPERYDQYCR